MLSIFLVFSSLGVAAFADGERTYRPGFKGILSQFTVPLDTEKSENRYLTLQIKFTEEPKAKSVAYDSGFHSVCKFHQGDLLLAARKLSPANDWRVKVTFFWPVSSSSGITVFSQRHKFMWISNCRST